MSDDDKPDLKLRPPRVARIRRPGAPLPEPPSTDLVPELRGETVKLNFKADGAIVDMVNEHMDRLEELAPFFPSNASDAIRSLIQEGTRSFRERDLANANEDTDDDET